MIAELGRYNERPEKSAWLRFVRIMFGLIAISAAFLVLTDPALGVFTLVLLLSFAMISIGIARLARAFSHTLFRRTHRIVDAVAGILGIILGFLVLADPMLGASTLVLVLAFATMIYGIGSIVIGALVARLAKWVRALIVIFGIVAIVFAFIVLANPAIAILTLVFFLAISLIVNGVESIVSAI